eukprot:m.235112 g.235112  ORF g.235112 m.235112 type:complete len:256 (+) comp12766_c0_seq1:56-823(+)
MWRALMQRALARPAACARPRLAPTRVFAAHIVRGPGGAEAPKAPVSWKSLMLIVLAGGSYISYFQYQRAVLKKEQEEKNSKSAGAPMIGGPFELVNTEGKTVTNTDFEGKWMLLYFGFTFCPDVCPEELNKITDVVNNFDKCEDKKGELVPIFISVDPQRDTYEKIAAYLKDFHPKFVGLTGSDAQLRQITKAFRVYYSKPSTDPSDTEYLVDHSIMTYLIDPSGNFAAYYGQNVTADKVADAIARQTRVWEKTA